MKALDRSALICNMLLCCCNLSLGSIPTEYIDRQVHFISVWHLFKLATFPSGAPHAAQGRMYVRCRLGATTSQTPVVPPEQSLLFVWGQLWQGGLGPAGAGGAGWC
jgi:hypothetical protein